MIVNLAGDALLTVKPAFDDLLSHHLLDLWMEAFGLQPVRSGDRQQAGKPRLTVTGNPAT
nr:hypothetical protein [Indioceanicola profundi]